MYQIDSVIALLADRLHCYCWTAGEFPDTAIVVGILRMRYLAGSAMGELPVAPSIARRYVFEDYTRKEVRYAYVSATLTHNFDVLATKS